MRPAVILVLLLGAACREEPVPPSPPEIAIAEEPPEDEWDVDPRGGRLVLGRPDGPVVALRVRDGGLLQVKDGDAWKDATLDGASAHLANARDLHAREMRRLGRPEREEPHGKGLGWGSPLFLSIEAEPAVPWQHVQWLLTLAAEEWFLKLHLSDGTREMLAFVPTNTAIEWIPERLPPFVVLEFDVIPRAGVSADWNGRKVLRPTKVAYRASAVRRGAQGRVGEIVARLETPDPGDTVPWIARARAAAAEIPRVRVLGRIRAARTVPFATVFDVMETVVSAGFADVNLLEECSVPSKELRSLPRLPYWPRSYDPPLSPPPEDD
jgi:hypothetical protein